MMKEYKKHLHTTREARIAGFAMLVIFSVIVVSVSSVAAQVGI